MSDKADITHPGNPEIKYSSLVSSIATLLNDARAKAVREVNQIIVFTYWHIGQYIVEYEQGGKERAEYGTELLKRLSKDLTKLFGKGYSYRNLQLIKKFYQTFSIVQSVIAQSDFPLQRDNDKRDDCDRCDNFRGKLVELSNFQIGWNANNHKSFEPSNPAAAGWICAVTAVSILMKSIL